MRRTARRATGTSLTNPSARAIGLLAIDLVPWGFGPRRDWSAAPVGGGVVRALVAGAPAVRDRSPLSFSCLLRMRAGEGGPGGPSGASERGRLRRVREVNRLRGRIHLAQGNGWGEGGLGSPAWKATFKARYRVLHGERNAFCVSVRSAAEWLVSPACSRSVGSDAQCGGTSVGRNRNER